MNFCQQNQAAQNVNINKLLFLRFLTIVSQPLKTWIDTCNLIFSIRFFLLFVLCWHHTEVLFFLIWQFLYQQFFTYTNNRIIFFSPVPFNFHHVRDDIIFFLRFQDLSLSYLLHEKRVGEIQARVAQAPCARATFRPQRRP